MADKKKYLPEVETLEIFPGMGIKGVGGKPSTTVKGTKVRKEYADLKKAHHTKVKLLKRKEARKELAIKEANIAKFDKQHPGSKELFAKQKYSRQIKKQEKKKYASLTTKPGYTE